MMKFLVHWRIYLIERNTYIMSENEIGAMVAGFIKFGPEDIYNKMRAKALLVIDKMKDLDDEFLDRAETLLVKARQESETVKENERDSLERIYYTLSFMLRKLAHEIYRKYLKKGEKRDNGRFLRLISCNKDAPLLI